MAPGWPAGRLSQNPLFVLHSEGAALSVNDHLRVGSRRIGRLGRDGFACRCTSVGLASLVLPTFSGRQNREGVEDVPLCFTLIPVLALLSNYDRVNCLINVGTEGNPYRNWLLNTLRTQGC